MTRCSCGSGRELDQCCGPIIAGSTPAPTAEALMRSRYTAFVRGDLDHIDRTHAREMRDIVRRRTGEARSDSVEWIGLEIIDRVRGGADDDTGTVEFAARYRKDGAVRIHRERSNFRREGGCWVYVDGDVAPDIVPGPKAKAGRNAPCPCGSGRKFKKCCGA